MTLEEGGEGGRKKWEEEKKRGGGVKMTGFSAWVNWRKSMFGARGREKKMSILNL